MFGQGWPEVPLDPEGGVVVDPDGGVVEPEGWVVEAPGVAAVEGEVLDVAGVPVAAETAELIPTPNPAAPPKMPRASRVFLNGVRMGEIDPLCRWAAGRRTCCRDAWNHFGLWSLASPPVRGVGSF